MFNILCSGLEQCVWPGRCQIFDHHTPEGSTYFLDGAHTVESVEVSENRDVQRCTEVTSSNDHLHCLTGIQC